MIEVSMPYNGSEAEMMAWCGEHVGRMAPHRGEIGKLTPWYPVARFAHTVFFFARETDAFLFKLRWL